MWVRGNIKGNMKTQKKSFSLNEIKKEAMMSITKYRIKGRINNGKTEKPKTTNNR